MPGCKRRLGNRCRPVITLSAIATQRDTFTHRRFILNVFCYRIQAPPVSHYGASWYKKHVLALQERYANNKGKADAFSD